MPDRKKQARVEQILKAAPVVPVMVIDEAKQAVPLAKALVAGGLPVLEITLRTATAMDSIRAIMAEVNGAIVGAGTVMTPAQLEMVAKAGCAFAVSPGSSPNLLDAAAEVEMPLLPGGVTATEVMSLLFTCGEPCTTGSLAAAVGLAESTVSHHLGQLRAAGFVISERQGMNVHHTPRRDALAALCRVLDPNCC